MRTALAPDRKQERPTRPSRPRRSPTSVPPSAAAALALQRSAGNSATGRLLRRTSRPTGRALQRYQAVHVAWGPQEEATFDYRRAQGIGFFGTANHGWIEIGTGAGAPQPKHHASSIHNVAHTEEELLQWAVNQGADLTLAPNAAAGTLRVLGLYTERQPCNAVWANAWDQARAARGPGNCHALLTNQLHATTPVYYSTPNSTAQHNLLMFGHAQRDTRYTEIGRLNAAFTPRIAAMRAANALPAFRALRDTWRGYLTAHPAPTVLTYNAWRLQMTQIANLGIVALNAFQPPKPTVDIVVDTSGPKKDPGSGSGPPPPTGDPMLVV